jgi:predicted RNA polymerase sigma factor
VLAVEPQAESIFARRVGVLGQRTHRPAAPCALDSRRMPYRMPAPEQLTDRLSEVLAVLCLLFNEGHLAMAGSGWRRDLSEDAVWLIGILCRRLPGEPEVLACWRSCGST